MAKNNCPECPKCLPGWLVQFGDLMSLLLTFFILLLSMAVMDKVKVEEYFEIMKKSMGFLPQNAEIKEQTEKLSDQVSQNDSSDNDNSEDIEETVKEMKEVVEQINEQTEEKNEQIILDKSKNEFTLDIPSTIMFVGNEYEINNQNSKKIIAKIARVVRTLPHVFNIEVIGHTDANSFSNSSIPRDNWDISALRSISVVKELIRNKIDPAQLKVSAYSSYHPRSSSAEDNRRVELRFYSENNQQNILLEENFFDRLEQ